MKSLNRSVASFVAVTFLVAAVQGTRLRGSDGRVLKEDSEAICRGLLSEEKCLAEELRASDESCMWCTVEGGSAEFCLTKSTAKMLPKLSFTCTDNRSLAEMASRVLLERTGISLGWGPTARDPDDYVVAGKHGFGSDRKDCKAGKSYETCPEGCTWCVDTFGHQEECMQRDAAMNIPSWVFDCKEIGHKPTSCGGGENPESCSAGCFWCENPALGGSCYPKHAAVALPDAFTCLEVTREMSPCSTAKFYKTCGKGCVWCASKALGGACYPEEVESKLAGEFTCRRPFV